MEDFTKFRRTLATISIIFFVGVLFASSCIVIVGRSNPESYFIAPTPPFYPGDRTNFLGYCDWTMMGYGSTVYCSGENLFYTQDITSDVITKVTLWMPAPTTLGDIMTRYGDPIGVQKSYGCQIHWKEFSVYLLCKDLSPHSKVWSITWVNGDKILLPWKGFTSYDS